MKRWQESIITIIAYAFALALGLSITFGCYYMLMLMAKKVFF